MFGNEEQKQKYLVRWRHGESLGAWGLTESQAGSDASARGQRNSLERRMEGERFQEFHHPRHRLPTLVAVP
jgi:alkylation response protein AidB-like acyl-CoA dehydrogenase